MGYGCDYTVVFSYAEMFRLLNVFHIKIGNFYSSGIMRISKYFFDFILNSFI